VAAAVTTNAPAAVTPSEALSPSPTESYGCVPHDNHWDCEGPISASSGSSVTSVDNSATSGGISASSGGSSASSGGSAVLAPSPTASYGCEPHDGHWHCDGARSTTGGSTRTTGTVSVAQFTGAAERLGSGAFAGLGLAAYFFI